MLPDKICFVDIETTGLSVVRDRIIEIGIVRIENNKIVKTYETLINPQTYISPLIESITGISKDALLNAPTFDDIKDELLFHLEDSVFVAHNVRFDYGFLRNEFLRANRKFSSKHFCTAKLSRKLFPQYKHHNLDSLIERFRFTCKHRHRAFDDAKILWDFYELLLNQIPLKLLDEAINTQCKKPQVPIDVSSKTIENLPELPGVYIFYGENEVPLYVGKSKNIRDRVLSHFTNDYMSSKEMKICQQIKDIKTIVTSGELSALIKESLLIKELQPIYNRMLRISRKLIILKKSENEKGYQTVTMDTVNTIDSADVPHILGIYRSKRQAKNFLINLAKKYNLCEKLLGLENTNNACFSYRLNACKGACIDEETALKYNLRFIQAFTQYRLKTWPFPGPIIIKEKNEFNQIEECIVIDKWCLIGNITIQDNEYISTEVKKPFDLDIYKILVSFLQEPGNLKYITTISPQEVQQLSFDNSLLQIIP